MKKNKQQKQDKKQKNKVSQILTSLKPYIINSIIAVCIFFITLYINDIAPFGKYTLAISDSYNQYEPMLFNFIKNIQERTLTSFSFLNGLGNSTFFNYVYYLSSPINFLAVFFKSANSMFLGVITIKIIIATITTTFYTIKKTNNKLISTIVSVSYVFSAWFLAFNQSIMWLDAFIMFPLFQYGLEKLMNDNKPYIYIFSLAYIMISNFYLAWMICLYTLAYFIFQTIFTKKEVKEKLKNFNTIALSTLVVMALTFFYIYITYDSFMSIDLYINEVTEDLTTIPILNIIKSFFTGNTIMSLTRFDEVFPNIALNTTFTISLLYYFINKNVPKKEKFKNLLVFIFIIVLFYSKTLNYIMNCFHVPIGYCFRYSFIATFFIVHIFIENYKYFDNKIYKRTFIINAILLLLLIIEYVFKNIPTNIFMLDLISIIIFTILLIFYRNNKTYKYIYTSFVILEILASAILTIDSKMPAIDHMIEYNNTKTTYREDVEYLGEFYSPVNLNFYDNKNTIPYFSSMQYNQVLLDLQSLGCMTDYKATITICPTNEVFNTLLNVKTNNNYHLEKIYSVNEEIQNVSLNSTNYFENQNLLLTTMVKNEKDVLKKYELEPTKDKNKYKVPKTGTYYLNLKNIYQVITADNKAYTYNKDLVTDKNIEVEVVKAALHLKLELKKNTIIEITYPSENDIEEKLEIYYFDEEELSNVYNEISDNQIEYISYNDDHIKGTIKVEKDQIIFTSIPYDKHWKVTIDGKPANKVLLLNSLLGIECEEGTHTIELTYKPNFTIPILISITTFISLITKIILDKRKQKKNEN